MKEFVKQYESEPRAVRRMREDIVDFARTCGFSDDDVEEIATASGEAFVNAVEHGHVPGSSVDVMYSSDERSLTISIKDAGGGLDASKRTWNSVVNKTSPGGYGRIVMNALMDDVSTSVDPGDGTTVLMRKDLTIPPI
jgi:anti-sigma regulatory factor (Ser/Thr protein kinase)